CGFLQHHILSGHFSGVSAVYYCTRNRAEAETFRSSMHSFCSEPTHGVGYGKQHGDRASLDLARTTAMPLCVSVLGRERLPGPARLGGTRLKSTCPDARADRPPLLHSLP